MNYSQINLSLLLKQENLMKLCKSLEELWPYGHTIIQKRQLTVNECYLYSVKKWFEIDRSNFCIDIIESNL